MSMFMFTVGSWNTHEGNETFGSRHCKNIPPEIMKKFAESGLHGMRRPGREGHAYPV